MSSLSVSEPMNVTSGNVAENWSYFREQWNDYRIATDLREKDKKVWLQLLEESWTKIAIIFIKDCHWR